MEAYHDLLRTILESGNDRGDRTGTGTRSCFGLHFRHNLADGFPLLTTKKLPWKAIVVELLWFLRGDTNIKYLLENDVHIWTKDCYRMYLRTPNAEPMGETVFENNILRDSEFETKYGDLGPVYGAQWRRWEGTPQMKDGNREFTQSLVDQIKLVINSIRTNPEGRRHIVSAWNPAEINNMALPPCHLLYQFYVNNNQLSCHMYQRSADAFLGVPFNIASYALLTHIIAHQCGLRVGKLIISFGDIHIYNNHKEQVAEQLTRTPKKLPTLLIEGRFQSIDQYEPSDFILDGYNPHPAIKGDLSVGT